MGKRWIVTGNEQPCGNAAADFIAGLGLHPIACRLLANRGLTEPDEIKRFLSPDWDMDVHDPFLFTQMSAAVERIFSALESGEKITVHGDYDADGVTGSAVLISTLREIEEQVRSHVKSQMSDVRSRELDSCVDSYIPHRDKEGYGLHPVTVDYLKERGTSLLITVDCGIASVAEIAKAKSLGMDVIVVDHHQFGTELPDAILIHPKLPGETYPFKDLAAVGVAWKVACALVSEAGRRGMAMPEAFDKWLLDFVAIATVTDMVPLLGENRVLEAYGLKVLNKTRRPGMQALIRAASGQKTKGLDTMSIAFGLGPRINAAGRMDHASLALKLMLAETDQEAEELATKLEGQNRDRQKAMTQMLEEAELQFAAASEWSVLAFWSENWPPALVGLIAGKYLDRTGKPTIAIGKHGDRWVGSGRSQTPFDITESMRRAGDGFLTHVGGHMQACGFSFSHELDVKDLVDKLMVQSSADLAGTEFAPTINIDAELKLGEVDWSLIETLAKFEPMGEANRRPIFMASRLQVVACDLVGQNQNHLRCLMRDADGKSIRFIGFNFGKRASEFSIGETIDVVFDVEVNEWNGRRDIQCKLVDVRRSSV
ncbi:single-stranded-DNA-specific exonuclease RecJ [Candidatus Uhrbacteria bacterium]|nr:single-stranded-DNA-specific exonuclease RecJ [Candidatus Uhrbacteria bacterium]